MKQYLILMVAGMLLTGCAVANIKTKGKGENAATCEASYQSAFKSLTDVELRACGGEGSAAGSVVDPTFLKLIELLHRLVSIPAPVPTPTSVPMVPK